jgi:hypothetical protein
MHPLPIKEPKQNGWKQQKTEREKKEKGDRLIVSDQTDSASNEKGEKRGNSE